MTHIRDILPDIMRDLGVLPLAPRRVTAISGTTITFACGHTRPWPHPAEIGDIRTCLQCANR